MNSISLRRLLIFVVWIVLQSFVFSKLPLGTFIQPCIYILFILALPFGYSAVKTLLWAFTIGLCIDLLSTDIIGMNTAATVALAFIRPYMLKLFAANNDFDIYDVPAPRTLNIRPYISYISLSVVFHQTLFFLLDAFAFYNILHTLLRIVLSSLCSMLFIGLLQILTPESRKTAMV